MKNLGFSNLHIYRLWNEMPLERYLLSNGIVWGPAVMFIHIIPEEIFKNHDYRRPSDKRVQLVNGSFLTGRYRPTSDVRGRVTGCARAQCRYVRKAEHFL